MTTDDMREIVKRQIETFAERHEGYATSNRAEAEHATTEADAEHFKGKAMAYRIAAGNARNLIERINEALDESAS